MQKPRCTSFQAIAKVKRFSYYMLYLQEILQASNRNNLNGRLPLNALEKKWSDNNITTFMKLDIYDRTLLSLRR